MVIGSLTVAIVTVISAVSKMKQELLAKAEVTTASIAEVKTKVDGNFSGVKAELVTANQRIAVLTERLLTTTTTEKEK
jgi:hypothetical protein